MQALFATNTSFSELIMYTGCIPWFPSGSL